jgi:hypothetical protein
LILKDILRHWKRQIRFLLSAKQHFSYKSKSGPEQKTKLGSSSFKKKMKVLILSKGGEGSNPKSKLFGMNFGSIEINLRGWVMGD